MNARLAEAWLIHHERWARMDMAGLEIFMNLGSFTMRCAMHACLCACVFVYSRAKVNEHDEESLQLCATHIFVFFCFTSFTGCACTRAVPMGDWVECDSGVHEFIVASVFKSGEADASV